MGRRRTGAKPYSTYGDKGAAYISCTIAKARVRESLGIPWADDRRSQAGIEAAAAKRYASLVEGRVIDEHDDRIRTSDSLPTLLSSWLGDSRELYPSTIGLLRIHAVHFSTFFRNIRDIMGDTAPQRYGQHRIKSVMRTTVRKELSSLFNFYGWCMTHDKIRSLPRRADLAPGLRGVRVGKQRAKPLHLTPDEALSILDALPEWAAKGGRGKNPGEVAGAFRVRDFFSLLWETGLRPGTISKLEVPQHWKPGRGELFISADIDKARYERAVPLTKAALAILARCAPKAGPVFGAHAYGAIAKRAAVAVLGPERAKLFAPYDLRHARATFLLAASQDMLGVGYMLGHKQTTTTNRYLHAAKDHADRTVELAELGSQLAADKKKTPAG